MESLEVALSLTRSFKDPLTGLFSSLKDEITYMLSDPLPRYIQSRNNKFKKTKTFLFRDNTVDFNETYFPIKLKGRKGEEFEVRSVESLYRNNNFTTIIGDAGSGKSMLLKFLFLKCLDQKIKIPIIIELKSLNEFEGSLTHYLYKVVLDNKFASNQDILERVLTSGKFYFLLDGYDEIFSEKKNMITHDIEQFVDKYPGNWFVITSRPGSGVESFPRFENNFVMPLSIEDVDAFVEMQCRIIEDVELADKVRKTIRQKKNSDYQVYLSSPLLLSMFLFTYRKHPQIPRKRSKFYWNVFDTLVSQHDSFTKKGGWRHERRSGLEDDEIEFVLEWFSYITLFDEIYLFDSELLASRLNRIKDQKEMTFDTTSLIYDLTVNLGLLNKDGVFYKFPHKTLQEYFTVKLISRQNDDDKVRIYNNNFRYDDRGSFVLDNISIYELCMELDEAYFVKSMLLHNLNEILIRLTSETDNERFIEFFLIYDILFLVDGSVKKYVSSTYEIATFESELLEYLGINIKDDKVSLVNIVNEAFPNIEGGYDEITLITSRMLPAINVIKHKEQWFPVFSKNGLHEIIEKLTLEIKNCIDGLNEKVKRMKDVNKNMLFY